MTRRTAHGAAPGALRTDGDPDCAAQLGAALRAHGEVHRFTHGFHTYPAGLHPDAASALLDALGSPRSVLDPFMGGGTVLVEAMTRGAITFGRDLSPVSMLVASARTALSDEGRRTLVRSTARKMTERARQQAGPVPDAIRAVLSEWYAPWVIDELAALREDLLRAPAEAAPLLRAAFSSLLVKVSWRSSDTSARKAHHRRPKGTTAVLFHKKVRELCRLLEAFAVAVPPDTPAAELRCQDAREARTPAPVQAVITSPPYPATYDYLPMQQLRNIWLDLDIRERAPDELGTRRQWREDPRNARARWLEDTVRWTQAASRTLAPGGQMMVVIGDGWGPRGVVEAGAPTVQALELSGLSVRASAAMCRPAHGRRGAWWEHAVWAEKPVRNES